MPQLRRSTARQASATPVSNLSPVKRSTRGASAQADPTSSSKRSLRSNSQAPDHGNGVAGHSSLPEVQTQQSYAYGSLKTPQLPGQLVARQKMSLSQMADAIDQEIRQADRRFQNHVVDAETNLTASGQPDARTTRAQRRTSKEDSDSVREGSNESSTPVRKTQRTAAWATSVDSSNLQHISEEDSLVDDDETRRGTDPSSFPSEVFDATYNYERGLRGPRVLERGANRLKTLLDDTGHTASRFLDRTLQVSKALALQIRRGAGEAGRTLLQALPYVGYSMVALLVAALVIMSFSFVFCQLYTRTLCDPTSTSSMQITLQNYCGSCVKTFGLPENITPEQRADLSFMSKAIDELKRQLREVESRIESRMDAKYSVFTMSIEELRDRQRNIEEHINKLENGQPSSHGPSSLMQKINYLAPGTGAVVNPYYTSPTLQRPFNLAQKIFLRATGIKKYTSNPPASALEMWEDVGDCWCSPGADGHVRLGVSLGHMIYPTEVVIEHYPSSGSPNPQTAPKEVEIWANLRHLTAEQFSGFGVWELKGPNPIAPRMAKMGTAVYDGRPGVNHVQTFKLDVNQGALAMTTDEVVVKVNSNHGAKHTCLYRVRLHGQPAMPHPQTGGSENL